MSFAEIRSLLYPTQCVACGAGNVEICPQCESGLVSFRNEVTLHQLPLYSALYYNETSSHLILAAKESNDRACARYLASLMAMRFSRIHRDLSFDRYLLIPIPSSRKADRRRGFAHTVVLSKLLAHEVERSIGLSCRVLPLLAPTRAIADQSRLTAQQRQRNIHGAFTAQSRVRSDRRGAEGIIVVDDLVTTGSTMGEALRALKLASYEPDALLSACVAGRFLANKIGTSLPALRGTAKKEELWPC
jgi:ComF family protein